MPDGGPAEASLAADYNAEMVEHIDACPTYATAHLSSATRRTSSTTSRPGPADIREWTEQHYDFTGYVTGFDPSRHRRPRELRASLGYATTNGLPRHRRRVGRRQSLLRA